MGGLFFATNAKMVLINDDQNDIADIVLDVWLFDQKSNHPSVHEGPKKPKNLPSKTETGP